MGADVAHKGGEVMWLRGKGLPPCLCLEGPRCLPNLASLIKSITHSGTPISRSNTPRSSHWWRIIHDPDRLVSQHALAGAYRANRQVKDSQDRVADISGGLLASYYQVSR